MKLPFSKDGVQPATEPLRVEGRDTIVQYLNVFEEKAALVGARYGWTAGLCAAR